MTTIGLLNEFAMKLNVKRAKSKGWKGCLFLFKCDSVIINLPHLKTFLSALFALAFGIHI